MAYASETDAARALASRVVAAIAQKPELVLALPTGRTPLPLYRELVRLHQERQVSFAKVHTFNLDEFRGLAPDDPGSFRAYMERHFFSKVDVQPERIHFLSGQAEDAGEECERYEGELAQVGGIDLAILGIGSNGHIAFNEPAEKLLPRTHLTKLSRETREANAGLFGGDAVRVPLEAYTMGMETILGAREVALMATGAKKAEILARALEAEITERVPASLLQRHPCLSVYADEAAAAKLKRAR